MNYQILVTQEEYEDILDAQEMDQERSSAEWEAPFPMTVRTQRDMADNERRIVDAMSGRLVDFLYADPIAQMTANPL